MAKKKVKRRPKPTTRKPIWTLESGITQSALKLFLRCREQFRLTYIEGWIPKRAPSKALSFGIIYHHLLAAAAQRADRTRTNHVPELDIPTFLANIPAYHPEMLPDDQDEADEVLSLIAMILPHYDKFWEKEDASQKWLAREEVFQVPFPLSTERGHVDLWGRWDGIYESKANKSLCVRDTKTKGRIDEDFIRNTLSTDMQFMLYAWAAQKVFGGKGYTVSQLEIDVVRQPQQRRGVNESVSGFVTRVEDDIRDRPAWYFMRWKVDLTPDDITKWVSRTLEPALLLLYNWWEDIKHTLDNPFVAELHYMNPDALSTGFGRCNLFDLITAGNAFMYKRRKVPFPELED